MLDMNSLIKSVFGTISPIQQISFHSFDRVFKFDIVLIVCFCFWSLAMMCLKKPVLGLCHEIFSLYFIPRVL